MTQCVCVCLCVCATTPPIRTIAYLSIANDLVCVCVCVYSYTIKFNNELLIIPDRKEKEQIGYS